MPRAESLEIQAGFVFHTSMSLSEAVKNNLSICLTGEGKYKEEIQGEKQLWSNIPSTARQRRGE